MKTPQNVNFWILVGILCVLVFRCFSVLQASHRAENLTGERSQGPGKLLKCMLGNWALTKIATNFREAVRPRPFAASAGFAKCKQFQIVVKWRSSAGFASSFGVSAYCASSSASANLDSPSYASASFASFFLDPLTMTNMMPFIVALQIPWAKLHDIFCHMIM